MNKIDRYYSKHFALAMEVMQQLHNMAPFATGNLRNNIKIVYVYPSRTIIEISPMPYTGKDRSKSYAQAVNNSKKHKNWVQKTLELSCKSYAAQIGAKVIKEKL